MTNKSRFEFAATPSGVPENSIVIRDIGHKDGYASVTNDAEGTVATVLWVARQLAEPIGHNQPPIFYYDSDNTLSQLEHNGDSFTGFRTGDLNGRD